MPQTVQSAVAYATVQEGLLGQQKISRAYQNRTFPPKTDRPSVATGELCKARKLKEYRRANGLCYSCGEKFTPGHSCTAHPGPAAQLKIAEGVDPHEIISDATLDALVYEQ